MIMYVGLLWSFCSCLSCFYVLLTVCAVVFYQCQFIDLFSCVAASLFHKLTYLCSEQLPCTAALCGVPALCHSVQCWIKVTSALSGVPDFATVFRAGSR